MRFAHDDPDFGRIVSDVGESAGINPGQIEKDYWITHVLWALHAAGLEVWFKGGTCLSKGYRLIERFSEDLDVKIGTGTAAGLPPSPNWKGERDTHIAKRAAWFDALADGLLIDGCRITVNQDMKLIRSRGRLMMMLSFRSLSRWWFGWRTVGGSPGGGCRGETQKLWISY